ncbi:hypothetical protein APHAL10511_004065 [Amanita phalloides]|nr:hypothetical protein APHAL10511_004065 [Amanita phalloides]
MLDRIRRKLFLSVKIMGSSNSSSQNTSLDSGELLDILRRGSSALMRDDDGMDIVRFLDAGLEDILQDSKKLEEMRDAKIKRDVKDEEYTDNDTKLVEDAEEEERRLLSGVAQVQSRFFEGKIIQRKSNTEIADEWKDLQKRTRVDQTVMVDGMAFVASAPLEPEVTVQKPVKRERIKFESEEWCNYCRDGGELVLCNLCPRGVLGFLPQSSLDSRNNQSFTPNVAEYPRQLLLT